MSGAGRSPRCGAAGAALALWGLVVGWCPSAEAGQVTDWKDSLVNGCWACDTLNEVSDIGLGVAEQAFNALAGQTATLLGLLMGLWILFFAGRMFLPFGPEGSVGSLWNEGAKKLFRFAIVLGFLQSSQSFWDYVFIPLMSSGMAISANIMQISDPFEADRGTPETAGTSQLNSYCGQAATGTGLSGAQSVMHQIDCPLAKIQSQFGKGMLVGVATVSATNQASGFVGSIVRTLNNIIAGCALIAVYFFGFLLYPLLLIDVVMRVSVITVISPLAIAASMFKPTHHFAQKAAWELVHAALTLAFASVVAGIAKALLAYTFSHLPTTDGQPLGDWQSLESALEGGSVVMDLSKASFYTLIGVGILLIYMLRESNRMAHEFSGASPNDFSGATKAAATVAGGVGKVVGGTTQAVVTGMVIRPIFNRKGSEDKRS